MTSEQNQENRADADNNEENNSSIDGEDDNRLTFVRSIPIDAPALESLMQEAEQRGLDAVAARNEHERVISVWIEHEVLQSELHNERELNIKPNGISIDTHDDLWGINMKTIMEHLMEENGEN